MADYELTPDAKQDLAGIFDYTLDRWGLAQAKRYTAQLSQHLTGIGRGQVRTREVWKHRPDIRSTRCEHHFIFVLLRKNDRPLILAVLHEKMDLMVRLSERAGL